LKILDSGLRLNNEQGGLSRVGRSIQQNWAGVSAGNDYSTGAEAVAAHEGNEFQSWGAEE
jgi:hypothetical protein